MTLNSAAADVKRWNQSFGHVDLDKEKQAENWEKDQAHRSLALALVFEEVDELEEAVANRDPVETLDAICDIFVVVLGLAAKAGLSDKVAPAFEEVMRSNWSKLDENGEPVYYENGKIAKSDLYQPPNLEKVMREVDEGL